MVCEQYRGSTSHRRVEAVEDGFIARDGRVAVRRLRPAEDHQDRLGSAARTEGREHVLPEAELASCSGAAYLTSLPIASSICRFICCSARLTISGMKQL